MVKKVVIDTDLGDDLDDAYALVFALNSSELDVEGILTNNRHEKIDAQIAHKLMKTTGEAIPVFQGIPGGKGRISQEGFVEGYNYEPEKLKENLDFFQELFQDEIHYVATGGLTNLAFLLDKIPRMKDKAKLTIMGGAINKDYHGKDRKIAEWNISSDVEASQKVFNSEAEVTVVPLDCTWNLELRREHILKIRESKRPWNQALNRLHTFWKQHHPRRNPILFDVFAVAILIHDFLAEFEEHKISVTDYGKTVEDPKGKNIKVAMESQKEEFTKLFMERLLSS